MAVVWEMVEGEDEEMDVGTKDGSCICNRVS